MGVTHDSSGVPPARQQGSDVAGVTFDSVTKRYGDVTAVDGLSLDIDDGEFMVLLGPSGCGKTTALRMIAGLEDITEGVLTIGDRVVNHVEPAGRDVAMVFQNYALYPHMTVRRNIESPLLVRKHSADGPGRPLRKLTKAERADRVSEAADVLELTPYLGRKPKELSGGQRQRVALARAWVARPKAFLMDEPLSNLDATLRAQTRRELVNLHTAAETTVVYVTHDQVEAMTMATKIAVMANGELQQVGTPVEVYERPANTFVARFIGTPPMNCLRGTFTTEDGPAVVVGTSRFPVPPTLDTRLADGSPVIVGVRPEHVALNGAGSIEGDIDAVEWLGHEQVVYADVDGQQIVARTPGIATDQPAGRVTLVVKPEHVHLFDPETTVRLS